MGLTISGLFNKLFGNGEMRILMGTQRFFYGFLLSIPTGQAAILVWKCD
jgi:hypothetical protein